MEIFDVVAAGNLEELNDLLNGGVDPNSLDPDGRPILFEAAFHGLTAECALLIDHGANLSLHDMDGRTVWDEAVASRCLTTMELFVSHGIRVRVDDLLRYCCIVDSSALQAGRLADPMVARFLAANGSSVELSDGEGSRALHYAASMGSAGLVEELISLGAEVDSRDVGRRTPLICAASFGHSDCAQVLLSARADVNATDGQGLTPLMWAAGWANALEIVRTLVQAGARREMHDNIGLTALDRADVLGPEDVIELLRD